MWQKLWTCLYFMLFRPLLKWCLRRITGQCELQRICYQMEYGAPRTKAVEYSMQHSRCTFIKKLTLSGDFDIDEATEIIMKRKRIKQPKFSILFKECLIQICGYKSLIKEVEDLRKTTYSSDNNDHEVLLMKVWNNLQPENPLDGRITKKWGEIGFQGDDPKTDFRGMGLLGLHNLVYFVSQYTLLAKEALSHSHHPQYGYSFAIVGINITSMAYQLLLQNHLKTHFYNHVAGIPQLSHFHQVYSYLFFEFDRFWMSEKPENIMAFSRLRDRFEGNMVHSLQDDQTILKIKVKS